MGLIWTSLRNSRSFKMNQKLIGYELNSDGYILDKADTICYAKATRDRMDLYESASPVAPLFYPARLAFPQVKRIMTHPHLNMNLLRMVHEEQEIIWRRQLKPGEPVSIKSYIRDIFEVPAGEMIRITCIALIDSIPAIEATIGLLVRGRKRRSIKRTGQQNDRNEIFRYSFPTYEGQNIEYARASGDRNLIHTNNIIARLAGLPRSIMHGFCVMAMTANRLRDELTNGSADRLKKMKCRFSRPALPGQHLTITGYDSGRQGLVYFEVLNDSGKKVISDGEFEYDQENLYLHESPITKDYHSHL